MKKFIPLFLVAVLAVASSGCSLLKKIGDVVEEEIPTSSTNPSTPATPSVGGPAPEPPTNDANAKPAEPLTIKAACAAAGADPAREVQIQCADQDWKKCLNDYICRVAPK